MKKPASPKNPPKKSKGTVMAEETRAQANGLSDAKRQELVGEALALIYRGKDRGQVRAHCR